MKMDVKVTNLGKLETGTIKIRPMTVLAGPNGTGKSFFTKSLYSIFNVINKNVYHISINQSIILLNIQLDGYISALSYRGEKDYNSIQYLKNSLKLIQEQIEIASKADIREYLDFAQSSLQGVIDKLIKVFDDYISSLKRKPKKLKSIKEQSAKIKKSLLSLKSKFSDSNAHYEFLLSQSLPNELHENFQVLKLSDLVTFGKETTSIVVDGLVDLKISRKGCEFSLGSDFVNEISSFSRVVFFESPAYWNVRNALKYAKESLNLHLHVKSDLNNILTGVPKYFYDLDEALKLENKSVETSEISELISLIQSELGGEFVFNGDTLIFKDEETGKEIPTNLISFGMTNLGMIHTLLKNNLITTGSFVFIDEPETNLHPEWQVLLMNVLIKLASLGVNIVMATHSIDMLKALEVGIQEQGDSILEDFMSIHYFDTNGQLLEFDSTEPIKQLIEARSELNTPYSELYSKGSQYE